MMGPERFSLEGLARLLRNRNRHYIADMLSQSYVEFDESSTYGSYWNSILTTAEIYAPVADYDRLRALSREDNECILDAILEIWPARENDIEITNIAYRLDPDSLTEPPSETQDILGKLDRLRNIMVSVSTGGPRIDDVNDDYKETYFQLARQLAGLGLQNPILYEDLWDWYGKWSSGDLPTYRSRREYIRNLFASLESTIRQGQLTRGAEVFDEPTGWGRVDRTLHEVRRRLESASTEDQFQSVGHLCREALISLAQVVYDPNRHPPIGGDTEIVSKTDAKRMLDRYIAKEVGGASSENPRRHAKASLDLANDLQHKRTAGFRDAALCAQATTSVVNIIAILSGIRDP